MVDLQEAHSTVNRLLISPDCYPLEHQELLVVLEEVVILSCEGPELLDAHQQQFGPVQFTTVHF
ncbi:hypothetical protein INR49_007658 [Caranx melampygus]|nr:hypothetical protein INR49_007658 [Caranx melampygus]